MTYRPKNWPKDPCKDCERKEEDEYGLFCDIVCGKFSAYANYNKGADDLLNGMKTDGVYIAQAWEQRLP